MDSKRLQAELQRLGIDGRRLKDRGLHAFEEAEALEIIQTDEDGREHQLTPEAAAAWHRLQQAASAEGITLFAVSAFRGIERQIRIIRRKLEAGKPLEQILVENAPPGYSEHHTGRAVDIGTTGEPLLELSFGETPAFGWLLQHAGEFDFTLSYPADNAQGYQYEPWHWCHRYHEHPPSVDSVVIKAL
jgi:D-alanyl-D-alanine carboxypeptidase